MSLVALLTFLCLNTHQKGENNLFDVLNQNYKSEAEQWLTCTIPLPIENMTVRVEIRKSHPFLSEYERVIIIEELTNAKRIRMFSDTGSSAPLYIFLSSEKKEYLKLSDKQYWCVLNLSRKELSFANVSFGGSEAMQFRSKTQEKAWESRDWKFIGTVVFNESRDQLLFVADSDSDPGEN